MHASEITESLNGFVESESFSICVATDMASRGLDVSNIGHVVLYDFPKTVIDYIHRVGRTARFGKFGRATSFITKRDADLAQVVQNLGKKTK